MTLVLITNSVCIGPKSSIASVIISFSVLFPQISLSLQTGVSSRGSGSLGIVGLFGAFFFINMIMHIIIADTKKRQL